MGKKTKKPTFVEAFDFGYQEALNDIEDYMNPRNCYIKQRMKAEKEVQRMLKSLRVKD